MAEKSESFVEYFGIEIGTMSEEDKVNLIVELCDTLSAARLRQVRELAEQKRLEKLEDAKQLVIAEMRARFTELDLDFDEVMGTGGARRRRREAAPLPAKYRGPNGEIWSGRGMKPKWIRELEDADDDLTEFRVQDAE